MSNDIFVLVEHRDGAVAGSAYELLGRARGRAAAPRGGGAGPAARAPLTAGRQPLLLLVPNSGSGMDVAAGLSAATGLPLAAYAVDVAIAGGSPTVTCQLYAGKINVRVRFDGGRGIATLLAPPFPAAAGQAAGSPAVERIAPAAADARIRFRRLIRPEAGGVDITKESILVSIGRGIGEADNVELAERLGGGRGGGGAAGS